MRVFGYGLGLALALGFGLGMGGGCAAGSARATAAGSAGTSTGGQTTTGGNGGMTLAGSGGGTGAAPTDSGLPDGFGSCVTFHATAQQAPAAMLVLLQGSSSMNLSNKWSAAEQAVVQAIDEDVFDTMSLGLMAWPDSVVTGPACIFGLSVWCGTPALPQVAVAPAGSAKSNASSGVRHDIYQFLTSHGPVPESADPGNSTPLYDAMNNAYTSLQTVTGVTKRLLAVITDGGGSCTSLSSPQRPYYPDGNDCPDWEQPENLNALISKWQKDPSAPVDTFIVGVPGSDSTGQTIPFPGGAGSYDTAPYHMRLALSTYAVSGSPSTVDPSCDQAAVFSQTGADPAMPCHIDLSSGTSFNPTALATAITDLRGKALGCTYPLPTPPPGQMIDTSKVNVVVTIGGVQTEIPRRSSPSDMCLTSPCWDYDASGDVVLIGEGCSELSTTAPTSVDVYVGCATILK